MVISKHICYNIRATVCSAMYTRAEAIAANTGIHNKTEV